MRVPVLAVSDGAPGFRAALRDVWPATRMPRCWCTRSPTCSLRFPPSQRPSARRMLAEIRDAEGRGMSARASPTRSAPKWRNADPPCWSRAHPARRPSHATRRATGRHNNPCLALAARTICVHADEDDYGPRSAAVITAAHDRPHPPFTGPTTLRATTDGAHPTTSGQPQRPVSGQARPTIGASPPGLNERD